MSQDQEKQQKSITNQSQTNHKPIPIKTHRGSAPVPTPNLRHDYPQSPP
jgi:hypothetical protein